MHLNAGVSSEAVVLVVALDALAALRTDVELMLRSKRPLRETLPFGATAARR